MFDIFKKDIDVGDQIKLHLINSNEKPEGTVLEIGENFVLLKYTDGTKSRFFDKLIGGWDLIKSNPTKETIPATAALNNPVKEAISAAATLNNPVEEAIPAAATLNNPVEETISSPAATEKTVFRATLAPKNLVNTVARPVNNSSPVYPRVHVTPKPTFPFSARPVFASSAAQLEKEIKDLIKAGKKEKAMQKRDEYLKNPDIIDRNKSNLLLTIAQLYSTLRDPENSENAYKELISFNEKSNELRYSKNENALSHYCTELARLQAQKPEKLSLALETVKKAIKYNGNNIYARNLLKKLEYTTSSANNAEEQDIYGGKTNEEGYLLVDAGESINEISIMLKTDFEEHKYTHPLIINHDGIPTQEIADSILRKAEAEKDLGKRYLVYLDAAKAYSELAPGSYDLQNFQRAAAFYAYSKGDLLYNKFKNEILENNENPGELTRMKDSACSYYLESTKLLSTICPEFSSLKRLSISPEFSSLTQLSTISPELLSLLKIITNYLSLNVVLYNRKNSRPVSENDFLGKFNYVVKNCLRSNDGELKKIVWITLIDIGWSSPHTWNALALVPGGTSKLYAEFNSPENKDRIYKLINFIWGWNPIDITLKPKEFLQAAFKERQKLENEFERVINDIRKIKFEGDMIDQIIQSWNNVSKYEKLLTDTDKETKKVIDNALEIAKPYLKRNPDERTNILLMIQDIIGKQIDFINKNTTMYGRTYFFRLISNWKKDIGGILLGRALGHAPELIIKIDPQFYHESNNGITIPLIVKNEGEATAEGCVIEGKVEKYSFTKTLQYEIPAGEKAETIITAPLEVIKYSKTIRASIDVRAKYLNKIGEPKNIEFTLDKETGSNLTIEDIPWNEGDPPGAELFKGREGLIDKLYNHYCSLERGKPYILYGLTRTGKSSILKYFKEKINGKSILMRGLQRKIITINWDFADAANSGKASEFWDYIVNQQSYHELPPDIKADVNSKHNFEMNREFRAKDFQIIIDCFNSTGYYPLFLVDEFSYIKFLFDKDIIQPAFLATLRQYCFSDKAGFLFAGTYDIKELIKNEKYGITGQLVHTIDCQIDKIGDKPAKELITVLREKLVFTDEAISHIKKLSGNIPFFIQLICKYCGYYAVENKRHSIGYPELEKVVRILCGSEKAADNTSLIKKLSNDFQNNQYDPRDPDIVHALVSSITWLNRDSPPTNPRGVRYTELEELWNKYKVPGFRPKLAAAIKILSDKRIITSEYDEVEVVYRISVDLFRRWWYCEHPDIKVPLAKISED